MFLLVSPSLNPKGHCVFLQFEKCYTGFSKYLSFYLFSISVSYLYKYYLLFLIKQNNTPLFTNPILWSSVFIALFGSNLEKINKKSSNNNRNTDVAIFSIMNWFEIEKLVFFKTWIYLKSQTEFWNL